MVRTFWPAVWMTMATALGAAPTAAQDDVRTEAPEVAVPVIVTATRIEQEAAESGSSVSVVTAEAIRERGHDEVQEVLRTVPGLHVARVGGRGSQTTLFVRGAETDHAVVMIDGFQINRDGGFFDWGKMFTLGVERVEVVRGAGSAPHGSDAVSGSINLILRQGEGDPRATVSFEGGSFGTYRERLELDGRIERFSFALSGANLDQTDPRFEHNDLHQSSTVGRFDFEFSDDTSVKFDLFLFRDRAEINAAFVPPLFGPEDPNAEREEDQALTALEGRHRVNDWCEVTLALSRFWQDPEFTDKPDASEAFDDLRQRTTVTRHTADLGARFAVVDSSWAQVETLVGFEFEHEFVHTTSVFLSFDAFPPFPAHAESRENRENRAVYLTNVVRLWDRVTLELGGRFDNNAEFGEDTTGRAALSYRHEETGTRVHASWGKGIKEPTFFENFDPQFGNPALGPETGRTWDVGVGQTLWDGKIELDFTYFNNRLDDLIQFRVLNPFPFAADFINAGKAKTDGVELTWSIAPIEELVLAGTFTHLNTEVVKSNDPANVSFTLDEDLLRRPDETAQAGITGRPIPGMSLNFSWLHVGEREDGRFDLFPATRAKLDGYDKFDFAAEYRFDFGLRLFGAVENLTGEDYEEALGFPGEECNALGGAEYTLEF